MPASQMHIGDGTPMGANLVADGATFRVWAPRAKRVYVISPFTNWKPKDRNRRWSGRAAKPEPLFTRTGMMDCGGPFER